MFHRARMADAVLHRVSTVNRIHQHPPLGGSRASHPPDPAFFLARVTLRSWTHQTYRTVRSIIHLAGPWEPSSTNGVPRQTLKFYVTLCQGLCGPATSPPCLTNCAPVIFDSTPNPDPDTESCVMCPSSVQHIGRVCSLGCNQLCMPRW